MIDRAAPRAGATVGREYTITLANAELPEAAGYRKSRLTQFPGFSVRCFRFGPGPLVQAAGPLSFSFPSREPDVLIHKPLKKTRPRQSSRGAFSFV